MTGAGVANADFGVPDLGLTTATEVVEAARRIATAVEIPVIADADTGYGGPLNVIRTVRELERAGAAALIIEDQRAPKRCGHFDGKSLVEPLEMVERIVAAGHARSDPDLVLFARSDAIAIEGFDGALEPARACTSTPAPTRSSSRRRATEAEMAAVAASLPVPCLINLVEGGVTPLLPLATARADGLRDRPLRQRRAAGRGAQRQRRLRDPPARRQLGAAGRPHARLGRAPGPRRAGGTWEGIDREIAEGSRAGSSRAGGRG